MPATIQEVLQNAIQAHGANDLAKAEAGYRQVLAADPQNASALHHLGLIAHQTGHSADALPLLRRSIELHPDSSAMFYRNYGNVARHLGSLEESLAALQRADRDKPNDPGTLHDLALTLDKLNRVDEAIETFGRAIALSPADSAETARMYHNLATPLMKQTRLNEARAAIEHALSIKPDYALAHMSLASLCFHQGDLRRGWQEYEWRWRCKGFPTRWINVPHPVWDGSDLQGRTLLIWTEQGLGDLIQFSRYGPLAAKRGGKVILQSTLELKELLRTLPGPIELSTAEDAPPSFDVHIPLMSLPRVFGTNADTIPADIPYLKADPQRLASWKSRLELAGGSAKVRVGIVWAGRPSHPDDANRSIPLRLLEPLLSTPGVQFFSLQKGDAARQLNELALKSALMDWTEDLKNFADTAALVSHLDLVITVDTAVAHLCGALGRPVWTMLPKLPDFRWMFHGDRTPWYPTMRLFRQTKLRDWPEVIARVQQALIDFAPS